MVYIIIYVFIIVIYFLLWGRGLGRAFVTFHNLNLNRGIRVTQMLGRRSNYSYFFSFNVISLVILRISNKVYIAYIILEV